MAVRRLGLQRHNRARDPRGFGGQIGSTLGFAVSAVIKRHPLVAFFVLAFALTWAPTPLGSFMAGGPLLAALVITAVVDGRRGLRKLWSRMIRWRVGWQWYAAALLVPLGSLSVPVDSTSRSERRAP